VDAIQLSLTLDQVSIWPKTQFEMDEVAEKFQRLLDSEFVGIFANRAGEIFGFYGKSSGRSTDNREGTKDFLKNQLSLVQRTGFSVDRVDLSKSGSSFPGSARTRFLTYIPLCEFATRPPKFCGFMVIGSQEPLDPICELAAISCQKQLMMLAHAADLEAEIQIRNQFLSIASHELKTPLTSIYGILQLQERMLRLKKNEPPFPDQERHHGFLKMVIRQTERLNELIDGLLDMSRIQNGRFMINPTDTDVAQLLKDCVQGRLNVIAQEAGVSIQLESIPTLHAWVDPVRMEEVISNLTMNAIRFSPEGGVVWIKLRKENASLRLSVRDQGTCIPLEDRERIFEPFAKVQRTARMGGLGLGLFISREIAQLHGGNVNLVESVPGKGNILEANFPTQQAA